MSEIRLLDDGTINKIAAGEVVDRPSSVVKELVENSIDAGATQIAVEIKDGGTSFIRISDNGRGIPREQVELAFLRHATSKITTSDDLEAVMSLGFRGEALASVAAVAQVEMTTKTDADVTASYIRVDGGQVVKRTETGGVTGTAIVVRNLFFNTPARRKFLKNTRAESGAVSDIVSFAALSRPDVAIKYVNNGAPVFQTNGGGDIRAAIMQIFGMQHARNLVDIDFQGNGIRLEGVLGKPELARGNRTYEIFFINGRYVRSSALSRAAENAYRTLAGGRFPFFVLHLRLDPQSIDVNVHPTKLEVRFSDEAAVCRIVGQAVEEALLDENLIPDIRLNRSPSFAEVTRSTVEDYTEITMDKVVKRDDEIVVYGRRQAEKKRYFLEEQGEAAAWSGGAIAEEPFVETCIEDAMQGDTFVEAQPQPEPGRAGQGKLTFFYGYTIVGQVFATYWIIEHEGSIYMIDQHAAHERILYEELLCAHAGGKDASQALLEPIDFNITEAEEAVLAANGECFTRLGFQVEPLGGRAYSIRGVPQALERVNALGFFLEVLGRLADGDTASFATESARRHEVAMHSCKLAVKGNDRKAHLECRELIARLQTLENPFTCPHGRPTIIEITQHEIERKFKRT